MKTGKLIPHPIVLHRSPLVALPETVSGRTSSELDTFDSSALHVRKTTIDFEMGTWQLETVCCLETIHYMGRWAILGVRKILE